jgi:phospholipid/cholesterol/gamma-HCH transport system substrate-binding protein
METSKAFEIKVGAFILAGAVIGFLIIFSLGDINLSKTGYKIAVKFDFASGIGSAAPVRLSGVGVGRVDGVNVVYSDKEKKSYAEVRAWIQSDAKIEEDAKITINTLGLLGEKYLEIYPGTPGAPLVKDGAVLIGQNPVVMEKLTENLVELSNSVTTVVRRLENGEGTIGKLLTEDTVYNDLQSTMGNVKDFSCDLKSTGTNFKDFSEDLKKHPWKLLSRPRGD